MWGIFMKKCFKCDVCKPLSDFYKHKQMADGHLNKCKDCTKYDVKKNRTDNLTYYKEYDVWRFINDPKVKQRHKSYQSTPDGKSAMLESRKKWNYKNPEARAAHVILNNAVRDGRVSKPDTCSCCGNFTPSRRLHGHHHDYSKPIEVTWLCVSCHAAIHNMD